MKYVMAFRRIKASLQTSPPNFETSIERSRAPYELAADNRQLGKLEFGSILASGPLFMALMVSAVCCS